VGEKNDDFRKELEREKEGKLKKLYDEKNKIWQG